MYISTRLNILEGLRRLSPLTAGRDVSDWSWSLNWGEITPQILIGTCPMAPSDIVSISDRTEATAILSMQHDDCLAYWGIDYTQMHQTGKDLGLTMERCPIRDFNVDDMRRRLPDAVRALAALQEDGVQ